MSRIVCKFGGSSLADANQFRRVLAIVESDPKATADFLGAAEYAFRHQLPDGDFSLVVPPQLQGRREASTADRVREEGGQRPLSSENGL